MRWDEARMIDYRYQLFVIPLQSLPHKDSKKMKTHYSNVRSARY